MNNTNSFHANAAAQGGAIGVVMYFLMKLNVDPALTAMTLPLLNSALSYLSTKVGDPTVASFIGSKNSDGKPVKVAAKKAPAKKAAPKKSVG